MPQTFTPPTLERVPSVLPDTRGVQFALFRYVHPVAQGLNVWKMPDGSYLLDQQPQQLSNPDPVNHANDAVTPVITYYGGHTYQVTDAEAAALTAAGFGANLSAAIPDPAGNPLFGTPPDYYGGISPPTPSRQSFYSGRYSDEYGDLSPFTSEYLVGYAGSYE